MIPWLEHEDPFPPANQALTEPDGLLAAGADLSPERLVAAYTQGIFPWFEEGQPILWWSPDPRMVLFPEELHVSRSLAKAIRAQRYALSFDAAFPDVMRACAEPRDGQDGTWISEAMVRAYTVLAQRGFAHSVEAWQDGALAGGVYGVAIGRVFFGESMFARRRDASKVALVQLVRQLRRWGVGIVDCQVSTPHLASLGARSIPRREFLQIVAQGVREAPPAASWRFDTDLYNGRGDESDAAERDGGP